MRTTHRVFLSSFLAFFLIAAGIAASAQTALQFVPVPAAGVVDTRLPMGTFGGPAIPGGVVLNLPHSPEPVLFPRRRQRTRSM